MITRKTVRMIVLSHIVDPNLDSIVAQNPEGDNKNKIRVF